ncbi:hypothetical protein Agub_g10018 [Astrephomene gubernaculifera]|uniref:Uncharacterized protein n=1 Tax=Astrephomene gubernaculifera TaxID=47775 RepID=A0AAD3HPI3_9CHLO|nr:hypothetical protein Agub_g10018 [Astrephomene gubernaculifera]
MDKSLLVPAIVGFTFSNHGESTLTAEVSTAKLRTQRSMLSELLAHSTEGEDPSGSDSEESDEGEDATFEAGGDEGASVIRQSACMFQRSEPITIPCGASLANERVKDAYRRLLYQRQVQQLYYQQQQQLQYQAQQQALMLQQRRLAQTQQQQGPQAVCQPPPQGAMTSRARGATGVVPVY